MTQTINPNQPLPVILASTQNPPPVWPLPVADWVVMPVVPPGFPTGPFTPDTTGLTVAPPIPPHTTVAA
jgi:hypothetical protein